MAKICEYEGCERPIWSRKSGRCRLHQSNYYPPTKNEGKTLKKTPLKKVSDKKKKRDAVYSTLRKSYLDSHPICEICCSNRAGEIHHRYAGADRAKYQNDTSTWLALCNYCHREVHLNPKWARDNDYLK